MSFWTIRHYTGARRRKTGRSVHARRDVRRRETAPADRPAASRRVERSRRPSAAAALRVRAHVVLAEFLHDELLKNRLIPRSSRRKSARAIDSQVQHALLQLSHSDHSPVRKNRWTTTPLQHARSQAPHNSQLPRRKDRWTTTPVQDHYTSGHIHSRARRRSDSASAKVIDCPENRVFTISSNSD